MRYTYRAFFEKEEGGGFTATVPDLPGCISYGEDFSTVVDLIAEAMELWIESNLLEGNAIPKSTGFDMSSTPMTIAVSVDVDSAKVEYRDPYITVKEAADLLGVSPVRVHQLIGAGKLLAEKRGRDVYVERMSIEERITHRPRRGRPRKSPINV